MSFRLIKRTDKKDHYDAIICPESLIYGGVDSQNTRFDLSDVLTFRNEDCYLVDVPFIDGDEANFEDKIVKIYSDALDMLQEQGCKKIVLFFNFMASEMDNVQKAFIQILKVIHQYNNTLDISFFLLPDEVNDDDKRQLKKLEENEDVDRNSIWYAGIVLILCATFHSYDYCEYYDYGYCYDEDDEHECHFCNCIDEICSLKTNNESSCNVCQSSDCDKNDNEDDEKILGRVLENLSEAYLSQANYGFQKLLFKFVDESGMEEVEFYKMAQLDRRLFSKIRCGNMPSKSTVLSCAIALKLSYEDTQQLLAAAGHTLSQYIKSDLIITNFIKNEIYDLDKINIALFEANEKPLNNKSRF